MGSSEWFHWEASPLPCGSVSCVSPSRLRPGATEGDSGGGTIGVGQGLSLTSQVDEPGNLKQALCCGSDFSFQHPEAFFVAHMRVERAYDVYWL